MKRAFTDPDDGDALTLKAYPVDQTNGELKRKLTLKKGTLTLKADGSFTFVPKTNATGTQMFVVQARDADGLLSPSKTFTIKIT